MHFSSFLSLFDLKVYIKCRILKPAQKLHTHPTVTARPVTKETGQIGWENYLSGNPRHDSESGH